jgi:methylglutaconyl-CoA hydratase
MSQDLHVERRAAVEYVTLNRPDVRNAFDERLVADVMAWAAAAAADPTLRVVVLRGTGPVFCAGADVGWMSRMVAYTREENERDASAMAAMFAALDSLPVPVIGRVHGAALGGGAGLAAICDIAVAASDTIFGFTEVKLGILPAVIAPYAVAKIGVSAARELFLTGARFSAERAREIGLVHRVVDPAGLDAAVDESVRELLTSAPGAIATAKRLIPRVAGWDPGSVGQLTARTIAAQRVSAEGQEGLRAFLDKRKPSWNPDA